MVQTPFHTIASHHNRTVAARTVDTLPLEPHQPHQTLITYLHTATATIEIANTSLASPDAHALVSPRWMRSLL